MRADNLSPVPPSSSSSTKKAAKLTAKASSPGVRFQGGGLFPLIVALVLVLGLGTIVYARQSVPAEDFSAITQNEEWTVAYGFYICDEWYSLGGDLDQLDADGRPINTPVRQPGAPGFGDGIIDWRAFSALVEGRRATLGVFFDIYGVEMNENRLAFADGDEFIPGETECDGRPAELSAVVWSNYTDTGNGVRYIANFESIRIQNDQMVVALVFMPRNESVMMPPWASDLPARAAAARAATESGD